MSKGTSSSIVREASWQEEDSCDEILFHLANFVDYIGGRIEHGNGAFSTGRLVMEAGGWSVTVDRVASSDLKRELKGSGGFGITNVGSLKRSDGSEFTIEEGKEVLQCLRLFFSFCRGAWVSLMPARAIRKGTPTWENWTPSRCSPYEGIFYLYPASEAYLDIGMLPGFYERWTDKDWRSVALSAVSWYLDANQHGVAQPGLVVSNIGLELLSWAVLVRERAIISSQGFLGKEGAPGLDAADRLRLLLAWVKVGADVPTPLSALEKFAKGNSNADGPATVTLLRNRLVHPPRKGSVKDVDDAVLVEAHMLSLWYLELACLFFFEYQGEYRNRLQQTEVSVPWAI